MKLKTKPINEMTDKELTDFETKMEMACVKIISVIKCQIEMERMIRFAKMGLNDYEKKL